MALWAARLGTGRGKVTTGRLALVLVVVALVAVPVTALAQGEVDSHSTTSVVPCTPAIIVATTGLSVDFNATCVAAGPCTWDFGDGQTGEGDVVSHTFDGEGEYTVSATCGEVVVARTLTVAAGSSYTGLGLVPFAVAIAALVLLSAGALFFSRRARAGR